MLVSVNYLMKRRRRWEFKSKDLIVLNSNCWCQVCGTRRDRLDVHHAIPRSTGASTSEEWNAVVLCRMHHQEVESSQELASYCLRIAYWQKETGRRFNPLIDKV